MVNAMLPFMVTCFTLLLARLRHPLAATLFLVALGLSVPAGATSFVLMADEELVDTSPLIVEGRIEAVAPAAGERPATDALLAVHQVLKGSPSGSHLVVRLPGGKAPDGRSLQLDGVPRLVPGADVLLFLVPGNDGTYGVHQLMLGAFYVAELPSGRQALWRDLGQGQQVSDRKVEDGFRDLELFRDWLKTQAHGPVPQSEVAPKRYFLTPDAEAALRPIIQRKIQHSPPISGCANVPARWFDFDALSRTWFLGLGPSGLSDGGSRALRQALEAWSREPYSTIRWSLVSQTAASGGLTRSDGLNTLLFNDPNDEIPGIYESSGILAVTGRWTDCENLREYQGQLYAEIQEVDIVGQEGLERFLSYLEDPETTAREIFAHEAGHALGFEHSDDPDALMRSFLHNDGRGAALDLDDLRNLIERYGNTDPASLQRPAAPEGLVADLVGADQTLLRWDAVDPRASNIRVERRSSEEAGFRMVTSLPMAQRTYFDRIEPGTSYEYRLRAQNAAGRSQPSAGAQIDVLEDRRPAPPFNLWSAASGPRRVRLSWHSVPDPETEFVLEVQRGGTIFQELPLILPWRLQQIVLTSVPPGRIFFRLRTKRDGTVSAPSNEAFSVIYPEAEGCVGGDDRLCLGGGRFELRAFFWLNGERQTALAVPATDRTGFFRFFAAGNLEIMVRLVEEDGGTVVEYVSLSDVEQRLVVNDHEHGETVRRGSRGNGECRPSGRIPFAASLTQPEVEDDALVLDLGSLDPQAPLPAKVDAGPTLGDCEDDSESACFLDRFRAEIVWDDGQESRTARTAGHFGRGESGGSTAIFTAGESNEPAAFVKLLDAERLNGHYWLYAGTFAEAGGILKVTDTVTGDVRSYELRTDRICPIADVTSFPAGSP